MTRIRLLGCCLALAAGAQFISLPIARAQAAAPPPSAPPLQLQQPMTAPAGATGPFVTLRSDNPYARLQQMQLRWQEICVTPCGGPVDPNGTYRVAGGTIRPSDPFKMPRASGPVLIDAHTGSTVKHWVGVGLAIGGGVSALSGVLYLALASGQTTTNGGLTTTRDAAKGLGIGYLVVGAILLAIGIPLASSSTTVDVR